MTWRAASCASSDIPLVLRTRPSRVHSGTSSSFAFRSHSAASTAEIAVAASPCRPMLRTARCIAANAPGGSIASVPTTTSLSVLSISATIDPWV